MPSRWPSRKRWRKLSRVASLAPLPVSASSSRSIAAVLGGVLDRLAAPLLLEPDRFLDQVAGDLLDVAADIADLGELGRLDLDERRVGELGQPPADLGLAAAGRADHQDVLGRHLLAQLLGQPLAAPAVAQRDRDRALGVVLADDMLVEGGDHRLGGETVVHRSRRSWVSGRARCSGTESDSSSQLDWSRGEPVQAVQRKPANKRRCEAMIRAIVSARASASHTSRSNVPPSRMPSARGNMWPASPVKA